jgi:hypothetical protein
MRSSLRILVAVLPLLAAAPAAAQFSQYISPGTLLGHETSKQPQIEKAVDEARWHLGPLRLAPWVGLRDAAWVTNVFAGSGGQKKPDFTVTVGAGLQGFLPMGPKTYLTIDALPEYVYWQKESERRRLDGQYGLGLYGFFNRLTASAEVNRVEEQTIVSSEFQQRIHTGQESLQGALDLQITSLISLFTSARRGRTLHLLSSAEREDPRIPPFEQLDREESLIRAGVELRPTQRLSVAVGAERSIADFLHATGDRSNSGTSPLLEMSWAQKHIQAQASVVFRSLKARGGSSFTPFDGVSGQAQVMVTPRWRFSYALYGSRNLSYSLEGSSPWFKDDRYGVAVISRFGRNAVLTVFGEDGTHDYASGSGVGPPRTDDFSAYGTNLRLTLRRQTDLSMGLVHTDLNSAIPGLDESLTVFRASLEISVFGGRLTVR